MEFTSNFTKITKNDTATAGGKGASLGEMTQEDIPVPPGFVVLSGAFERFIEETDLNVEIDAKLHAVDQNIMHTVEEASQKIQALILQTKMPDCIANEVQKEFKKLNTKYVAVRSSATAEDSSSAAWAGQLDSFLNTTEENLLENIRKCWASLFTSRAIFYRFEQNLHKQKISVAVVVQKMIKSEKSGIAFSVHPVTQDRNQLIIEAGFGLGEAIVSGQITPDSYVVEKQLRRIIDKNIQTQIKGLYRAKTGGNEWRNIPNEQGEQQVLSDKEIFELSEIILKIEDHYKFPVDIEWAYQNGKFFIVQSRPITTLQTQRELIPLAKIITREAPLISVESWYEGIVNENERFFGIKFLENFFIFRKGTVESWRDTGRLAKTPVELSKWVRKNQARLVEGYKRQKETLKVIGDIREKQNATEDEILANLDKIRDKFVKGFPGIVVTYLMPLWQEIFGVKGEKLFDEKVIDQCSEWRKETDPFFDQSIETMFFLLNKIAKVKKWDRRLMKYIGYQELISALKKDELNKKELLFRKESIFAYIDGRIIFEKDFKDELQKIGFVLPRETVTGMKEIKGNSANKGFVSGMVKVVFSREELHKVEEGDILVAPMTTPWYLPAMKKAAAFVTDEGGITCHAAIMAREMNKPCVIGTKVATQILKDNDRIEVDANSGIVSIVK